MRVQPELFSGFRMLRQDQCHTIAVTARKTAVHNWPPAAAEIVAFLNPKKPAHVSEWKQIDAAPQSLGLVSAGRQTCTP
jgi:hypothetical protein